LEAISTLLVRRVLWNGPCGTPINDGGMTKAGDRRQRHSFQCFSRFSHSLFLRFTVCLASSTISRSWHVFMTRALISLLFIPYPLCSIVPSQRWIIASALLDQPYFCRDEGTGCLFVLYALWCLCNVVPPSHAARIETFLLVQVWVRLNT